MARFALAAAFLLTACVDADYAGTGLLCSDGVCPAGQACVDGHCVVSGGTEIDAALPIDAAMGGDAGQLFERTITVVPGAVGAAQGAISLPLLLTPDRIDYGAAGPQAQHLEFTDAAGAPLAHEVATWNRGGTSVIWIALPELTAATSFVMHYDPGGGSPSNDPTQVWAQYVAVYHLESGTAVDSTANQLDGTPVGDPMPGPGALGQGLTLDGIDDQIDLGADRPFGQATAAITESLWLESVTPTGIVIGHSINGANKSRATIELFDGNRPRCGFRSNDDPNLPYYGANSPEPMPDPGWHYLVAVADFAGDTAALYIDGVAVDSQSALGFDPMTPDTASMQSRIGVDENTSGAHLSGRVDEVHLLHRAVDSTWVAVQYLAMTDRLFDFGPPQ